MAGHFIQLQKGESQNRIVRVEKLLDSLDFIDEKMWKIINVTKRSTGNSYQHRVNVEAHYKPAKFVGDFKVKSSSVSGKCNTVSYDELYMYLWHSILIHLHGLML